MENRFEIELKSPVAGTGPIREKILELGGTYLDTVTEEDLYFNHPCRDFRKTDEALRIRKNGTKCILTCKGPKTGGPVKSRLEDETEISDSEKMKKIFFSLGFVNSGLVRKKREMYRLEGALICIDSVEGLGDFVEIEMIAPESGKAEAAIMELARLLGLDTFEGRSYLEMLY